MEVALDVAVFLAAPLRATEPTLGMVEFTVAVHMKYLINNEIGETDYRSNKHWKRE